jgi:hypothetical protein
MNSVEKIENLSKKSQEAKIAAEDAQSKFEDCLWLKVMHLHSVGRSVLRKRLGDETFGRLNDLHIISPIPRNLAWLINPSPEISIRPPRGRQKNSELVVGNYLLPLSILSQSDRDFAKQIRTSLIKSVEDFENWEFERAQSIIERFKKSRDKKTSKDSKKDPRKSSKLNSGSNATS